MSEQGPALRFAPTAWGVKGCWPRTSTFSSPSPWGKSSLSVSAMSSGRRKQWALCHAWATRGASRTLRCFSRDRRSILGRPRAPSGQGSALGGQSLKARGARWPQGSRAHPMPSWLGPVARAPCSQGHCCLFPCWIESANPRMNFVCAFNKIFFGEKLVSLCPEEALKGGDSTREPRYPRL